MVVTCSSIAGFKSRVKFFSVLDPSTMCNYISEVIGGGVSGPLFKVLQLIYVSSSLFLCTSILLQTEVLLDPSFVCQSSYDM